MTVFILIYWIKVLANASNSVHLHFCVWNVILNSRSQRENTFHEVSIVKLYVYTKGKQIYRVCAAVHSPAHWGCVPTNTVGSGRVQSDSQLGKVQTARVVSNLTHRVREVHIARLESSLTHRIRGSAHRPGRVQYDSQSQVECTPPGSSPIQPALTQRILVLNE